MKKVFSEIGFGNNTFFSTEFEEGDSEYRVPKFILPNKIIGFYFRFWLFKKVFILSSNHGLEITKKDKNKLKILFGISGETKTLKFKNYLAEMILEGKKDVTWRLFDDKDLSVGDEVLFINKDTGNEFGTATLTHIREKALGDIDEGDFSGHEKFESTEKMCETYREYYGDKVTPETIVKIIKFELSK